VLRGPLAQRLAPLTFSTGRDDSHHHDQREEQRDRDDDQYRPDIHRLPDVSNTNPPTPP
jgi:hypothetical protein